ncbi:hypothetical protein Btru_020928 [Bulinus truncatus]|nr:hypothetical protein Btru_020928 [Bulinus truncatus]
METQFNRTGLTDDSKEAVTNSQVRINSAETDDVIADDLLDLLRVTVIFPANFFLAFIGVVSNVINMVVQSRLGLNSSMTVGLFALSFTDFLVTSLQLIISVCYVLNKVYPDNVIDFWAVGVFVFSWVRYLCFFASGWITATISVERCFCVVSPFNVRRIFTVNRCLAAIAFIYAVHVSLVAPIYAVQKLTWAEVDWDDAGRVHRRRQEFTIVFTEEFIDMQVILNNVYAIGLSLTAQVLMIVCTIVMICSLRASAQIRITGEQSQLDSNNPRGSTLLSSRERKMVKVVLGLVVLLTSCNIPRSEDYDVISDDLIEILELSITIPVHGVTSAVGIVTNLLSMIVLARLGLSNSMNVCLFALSLTDFLVTCLQLAICLCFLLKYLYPDSPVNMWVMGTYILGWVRYAGFFISCWITTLISVERCLCVVCPFTVRIIFNRARCVTVIVFIYVAFMVLVTPVYIYQKLSWELRTLLASNGTVLERWVLTVTFNEQTARLKVIVDTIGAVSLSLLSQVILTVCTIWMIRALRTTSSVRRLDPRKLAVDIMGVVKTQGKQAAVLSSKERRLLKVVICLALILIVCNLPRYAEIAAYHLIPGMNLGRYKNLAGFMWDLSDFFGTLNCSSNFLVF